MNITFDVFALAPALIPMVTALVVLLADAASPRRVRVPWIIALIGVVSALVSVGALAASGRRETSGLCVKGTQTCYWVADRVGLSLQALALATALVVCLLAAVHRVRLGDTARATVRATMVLAATAGCVGVVAARDIASWLVLIELATIPSVALVALNGGRRATHGALTLLVTALVSFAVLALGAALWFAATGSVSLSGNVVLEAWSDPARQPLLVVAMMLILAGIGFKLSLAPFHAWTPEAFAGSGAWVSAFLATTSKVGALGGMLVVLRAATPLGSSALVPLAIVSALSMTVGNLMALRQRNTLRLMAWSTVAQAGWVVLPMTVVAVGSVGAASAYLALYAIGTSAVFIVMAALEDAGAREGAAAPATEDDGAVVVQDASAGEVGAARADTVVEDDLRPARGVLLEDARGLFRTHPLLAATLALGLLALAGLPPSIIGVVAKIVALKPAVAGGEWWLVIVAALNAVIGVAVYLRWVAVMFSSSPVAVSGGEGDLAGASEVDGSKGAGAVSGESAVTQHDPLPAGRRAYLVLALVTSIGIIATSLAPQLLLGAF